MLREIQKIRTKIKDAWQEERLFQKEFRSFEDYFLSSALMEFNGVLTPPLTKLAPLRAGALTVPSYPIMKRLVNGQGLSEDQAKQVFQAEERALRGHHHWELDGYGKVQLEISIDNQKVSEYLRQNVTPDMVAFIVFHPEKQKSRYLQTTGIKVPDGNNTIHFSFKQINQIPRRPLTLCINADPTGLAKTAGQFTRLSFLLIERGKLKEVVSAVAQKSLYTNVK